MHVETFMYMCAISGSSGLRTGTHTPKQFWPIMGKPLLYYTLKTFECIPWISQVIVSVSPGRLEWLEEQREVWDLHKVRYVAGGSTRHRSIYEGIKLLARGSFLRHEPQTCLVYEEVCLTESFM